MKALPIVQACYGGEGGDSSVARILTHQFRLVGIESGIIAIAPRPEMLEQSEAWPEATTVSRVYLPRRADVQSMIEVARTVRRMNPRVVVCHTHRHAPALFAGQLLSGRLPRIVTVEHHAVALRSPGVNLRSGIALMFSRAVVLMSKRYAEDYPLRKFLLPGLRIREVIANGVDVPELPRSHTAEPRRTIVGMASRLVPTKDHVSLIRAIALLNSRSGDHATFLRIAGDGPTRPQLEALAVSLGIQNNIEFLGHLGATAMDAFYRGLDVYAHSTLGENMSIALLEAAAHGVPIVASDVEGVRGFLENERTALLVPEGSAAELAEGIDRAGRPMVGEELARNAHNLVADGYSSRVMMGRYAALFRRIDPSGPWDSLDDVGSMPAS